MMRSHASSAVSMPPTLISTSSVAHPPVESAQHLRGSAGPPGGRRCRRARGVDPGCRQPVAGHGRVGGDDPGEAEFDCQICDVVDVGVGEVGGDLDQHRRRRLRQHRRQDRPQRLDRLQVAQPRGVRGADVHHQVGGQRSEQPSTLGVVAGGPPRAGSAWSCRC